MGFIPFPGDCSATVKDYRFAIRCYLEAVHAPEPVRLDLGNVYFLRPLGLTLLSGMIYDLLRRGQQVYLTLPKNQSVSQYMQDQGFYTEFSLGALGQIKQTPRSTSVGLRRLDELDYLYLSAVASWLNRNSLIPKERVKDMVMVTMPEVINNVFDHSQSPFGCYVCAQAYPRERQLLLTVMDFGIGFLNCLHPHYSHLTTDADAIALAVQNGVSSKSNRRNAGRGLYILSDWAKEREGVLEIISHQGHWAQDSTGEATNTDLSFVFPGTCINLSVSTEKLPDNDELEEGPSYG